MHAKKLFLFLFCSVLFVFAGCKDDNNSTGPEDDGVTRTVVVENAGEATWLDAENTRFLFTYGASQESPGIFISDLEGNVTPLYEGYHNHDYVVSPNGTMVAFSTPELGGGIRYVTLDGDMTFVHVSAQSPAWLGNNQLLFVDDNANLILYSLETEIPEEIADNAQHPIASPNGRSFAYLNFAGTSGFRLYFKENIAAELQSLEANISTDLIWSPDSQAIVASRTAASDISEVVKVTLTEEPSTVSLYKGAAQPSISADGKELYANRIKSGVQNGIIYRHLRSGALKAISRAANPAAGNDRSALVEYNDNIYLISF